MNSSKEHTTCLDGPLHDAGLRERMGLDAAVFLIPHVGQQKSQSLDARGRGIGSVKWKFT